MADVVSREKRSQMMSGIKGKNTKPELVIRKRLHRLGFRFSLHRKDLPGKPDLVLPKYRAAIFIHGCFWHMHGCRLFKWPASNVDFWRMKLERNVMIDERSVLALREKGWRVCVIWECAIRGNKKKLIEDILKECSDWLFSNDDYLELKDV
jgi:DNA mismatch endonuclease (patch repair protein)